MSIRRVTIKIIIILSVLLIKVIVALMYSVKTHKHTYLNVHLQLMGCHGDGDLQKFGHLHVFS